MPSRIRIGVVGGTTGAEFQWHEHPDCVVQAVSDLWAERRDLLMKTYRCETAHKSLNEMLADRNVDAVAMFTGAPNHAKHSILALKSGKHVISGTPATFGSLEEAQQLFETVKQTGLTYMMAEPAYYLDPVITARRFQQESRFGELFSCDAEMIPAAEDVAEWEKDPFHWRFGVPPMYYGSSCMALLVGVSGERLTEVACHGWSDKSEVYADNAYNNPFVQETAQFKTDRGHAFRAKVWLKGGSPGIRANWYGNRMSLLEHRQILRTGGQTEKDAGGFVRSLPTRETLQARDWYKSDLLPEPLRHPTKDDNTHGFLTHEFIDALVRERRPAIDVQVALALTVPGIMAHQSAMNGGDLRKIPQYAL